MDLWILKKRPQRLRLGKELARCARVGVFSNRLSQLHWFILAD